MEKDIKQILITVVILSVVISAVVGGVVGYWAGSSVNSKGILGIIRLALTGKDITKNDLESCKIVKMCEELAATSTAGNVSSVVASTTQVAPIAKPWLGVRYVQIDQSIADANKLSVNYGALVVRGEQVIGSAVSPGSPADKAGIGENDIILSLNGQKLDSDHPLSALINNFNPEDEISLRILRDNKQKVVKVKLAEAK